MKKGIAVVVSVGLVAGLFATELAARTEHDPAKLTLRNAKEGLYEGYVETDNLACESRRPVTVFHDQNRNGVDKSDYRIGSDKTDKYGEYEVEGNQAPKGDRIVAQVKRKTLVDGTVCLAKQRGATALAG